MQPIDISGLLDNGVAVGILAFIAAFVYFRFWPWYTKQQEQRIKDEADRHDRYISSLDRSTDALLGVNVTMQAIAQLITDQTNRIDDHHNEVMKELRGTR